jgi:hypothetical protein
MRGPTAGSPRSPLRRLCAQFESKLVKARAQEVTVDVGPLIDAVRDSIARAVLLAKTASRPMDHSLILDTFTAPALARGLLDQVRRPPHVLRGAARADARDQHGDRRRGRAPAGRPQRAQAHRGVLLIRSCAVERCTVRLALWSVVCKSTGARHGATGGTCALARAVSSGCEEESRRVHQVAGYTSYMFACTQDERTKKAKRPAKW